MSLLTTAPNQNSGFPSIYGVDQCKDPEMIWAPGSVAVGSSPLTSGFLESEKMMENNCIKH